MVVVSPIVCFPIDWIIAVDVDMNWFCIDSCYKVQPNSCSTNSLLTQMFAFVF